MPKQVNASIFDFHGRPSVGKALPLSLQHVLAMIAGVITPSPPTSCYPGSP